MAVLGEAECHFAVARPVDDLIVGAEGGRGTSHSGVLGSLGLVLDDPELVETLAKTIPVGRMGTPADVGAMAVYLASDEASWITGQTIGLNGGQLTS